MRSAFLVVLFASGALLAPQARAQSEGAISIARVQYGGGGDWYSGDPLPTLIEYARRHALLDISPEPATVELTSDRLFLHPFLFLNGHGNIAISEEEAGRLRRYLTSGGFLYVNDDYGMDEALRRELAKVFPEQELTPLAASHPIYSAHFRFPDGLPKIHEHDGEAAQGLGLFHEGRLVVFYAYQSDLADGWEPEGVHPDPPEVRERALQMGVNLLVYAMTQGVDS
ncbi:DUF4159 domain-containing protein [Rubricoccus marinus]|uniref:DUF4159 domain-containing protein n=1 Tax=Rubricoccus marinus TaxID=716817 RepID=A0A259U2F7_9BACT|nr:DUF4159 domain-containing protein [Rubricoccus marinus]OZC04179.1 hypothetical protein BSZ36_15025 [Rubricoccus marinus]